MKTIQLQRNVYVEQLEKFDKDKTVWKNFKDDDDAMIDECLEQDLKWGKVMRLCKLDEDKAALKKCLRKHYLDIKNMFLLIASNSNYPTIGLNDYTTFI